MAGGGRVRHPQCGQAQRGPTPSRTPLLPVMCRAAAHGVGPASASTKTQSGLLYLLPGSGCAPASRPEGGVRERPGGHCRSAPSQGHSS